MIFIKDNVFHLSTRDTSYIFRITVKGDLEHLYYGEKIEKAEDYSGFFPNNSLLLVSTLYTEEDYTYGIDGICFEYSCKGNGDMRDCAVHGNSDNRLLNFKYHSYSLSDTFECNPCPAAHDADGTLTITLYDEITKSTLNLYYRVFEESNCITRSASVTAGDSDLTLNRLCSLQLDLPRQDLKTVTFNGAWGRERYKQEQNLVLGTASVNTHGGASSARHNPFLMLAEKNSDNRNGEAYGFNLIYSGNHSEAAECCPYGNTRFLSGIGFQEFSAKLSPNESFFAPEAVMTYSPKGYNGVSINMHRFTEKHILPPVWSKRERPILVNSWEAMYFDITEKRILELADKAVEIGAELLVVDDGWFGKRNDDTTSLGDWFVSCEKFPDGMSELSRKIHEKGLKFGLWFEPEMISKESDLFHSHPDWALGDLERKHLITGRSQFVLDLSRTEVQDYLTDVISKCIDEIGIDYIKWDYNRLISDTKSACTPIGEVMHRYILGLYRVLRKLTEKYPDLLFELCASGGNRFDLGMLSFMPVGWVSDNTDPFSRALIQEGTSYGYPLSVMCNHISICPNHQTKRVTDLESRFAVAAFGVLGLQYDLTSCDSETLRQLKDCVSRYKEMRKNMKNASFYRLLDTFEGNYGSWIMVSEDREAAYLCVSKKIFAPDEPLPRIRLTGLNPDAKYRITKIGIEASGDVFMKSGVILPQNYQGNESSDSMSNFLDFTARIYKIESVN